jgi:hypothetical protein
MFRGRPVGCDAEPDSSGAECFQLRIVRICQLSRSVRLDCSYWKDLADG